MTLSDAISALNTLAIPSPEETRILTTDEIRELFKNPPHRPRSIPMQEAMATVVESFRTSDEDARDTILSALTGHARGRFLGYASDQAVLAVRQSQTDRIEQGLVALAIENGGQDWRDSIVSLFMLHHSAEKLGLDTPATFAKVALLAEPGVIKKEMHNFPLRPAGSRSLAAFCMEEEGAGETFRYTQIPWSVKRH